MSLQSAPEIDFDFFDPKRPIQFAFSDAPLTSDAGLIPWRQFDEQLRLTQQFADALHDPRDPHRIDHSFLDLTRMRVFGIRAGYEDPNDHDTLRTDPVFKLITRRSPDDPHLASQPTLSRFENPIDLPSRKRLRDVLIDQFIASFDTPPLALTFDLDAVDDPAHGSQQLTLFHGFDEQHQYLPLVVTAADTDPIVLLSLRHGTATASRGADDDREYRVIRLRAAWPGVTIRVRGDGGFGNPAMHACCDRLDILFTFGQAANRTLQRASEDLLAEAQRRWEQTGQAQRLFDGFWYQAGTRTRARGVIVKAEANVQGTNRRFVTTNRSWSRIYGEATSDAYVARGESENRNKEFQCDLGMDRRSDHRFRAHFFRWYLPALAMNRLVRLRRALVAPPTREGPARELPLSSLPEPERKLYQNARRRHDPLGEGQPATWRTLRIKVAASVVVSCRRVVIRLSRSGPHAEFFRRVSEFVAGRREEDAARAIPAANHRRTAWGKGGGAAATKRRTRRKGSPTLRSEEGEQPKRS
jgi:hypothetical protein